MREPPYPVELKPYGRALVEAGALDAPYLFERYGLSTAAIVETIWSALGCSGAPPLVPAVAAGGGEYSPV